MTRTLSDDIRRVGNTISRINTGRAKAVGATALTTALAIGIAIESHPNEFSNEQLMRNQAVITETGPMLDATLFVSAEDDGTSVKVRKSPHIVNGDVDMPSNVSFSVDKGEVLKIERPRLVREDGEEWAAFEAPNSQANGVNELSKVIVYLATDELKKHSPTSLHLEPFMPLQPIAEVPVALIDNSTSVIFENTNTHVVMEDSLHSEWQNSMEPKVG